MNPNRHDDISQLIARRHHDPGLILGRHLTGANQVIRSLIPDAVAVRLADMDLSMHRLRDSDIFEWRGPCSDIPAPFRLEWRDATGRIHTHYEPYSFPPQINEYDLYLFAGGNHHHIYRILGARCLTVAGVNGVLFSTWAPNAAAIYVVGDFNQWDGRRHPMRVRGNSGVWELFIPEISAGSNYKFEIRSLTTDRRLLKADPYGRQYEVRPATASIIVNDSNFAWTDAKWIQTRKDTDWQHAPLSVYELHLGSWQRDGRGGFLNYRDIADRLVPYVRRLGFTHIELMPITEHPLDASWGYQTTGFYAPTSRFGTPDDFRYFVDSCHRDGIGVILDWVAGHFPKDEHGISRFDDTALYEHKDPRRGEHREWGTLIFNYSRHEVRNFLVANAFYWIEEFHLDGLRVDAVAAMLYLDYSRKPGEWLPNEYGGNENLEAIEFLRSLNSEVLVEHPDVLIIAEESTAWPQVTRPPWLGGLGFSMKWNMGWMHDTLGYLEKDPIHRHFHHENLTFGLLYAFHENFVLPLSHDEVVYGKRSMIAKMPGDGWQRFANLRLLYTYMFTYPGKKLLFMGSEFGQWSEWNHDVALQWELLDQPLHGALYRLLSDLNALYRSRQALHFYDFQQQGFEWIDCHDNTQSILSYLRRHGDSVVVVVLNFTPVPRHNYRLGVPDAGSYRELLNSDSTYFGGSNVGNLGERRAEHKAWMGKPCSLILDLPPLGGLILERSGQA